MSSSGTYTSLAGHSYLLAEELQFRMGLVPLGISAPLKNCTVVAAVCFEENVRGPPSTMLYQTAAVAVVL